MNLFFTFIVFFSSLCEAAIYGADQRRDISQLNPLWQDRAQAVALALPQLYLENLDENHFIHIEHDMRTYGEVVGLCEDEKFYEQKSFGHCTAFLIHPKVMLTAGHCFLPTGKVENKPHSYCENFAFWLGYNDQKIEIPFLGEMIAKKDVAYCKNVIYATNNEKMNPNDLPIDFALLELTEPVEHINFLPTSSQPVKLFDMVSTIGHPHGLPAKHSGFSQVTGIFETSFTAYLDTLSGNSGGPIFNMKGEILGLLMAGHQHDTYWNSEKKCDSINTCQANGKNCKASSELPEYNVFIKPNVWQPYLNDYLESL